MERFKNVGMASKRLAKLDDYRFRHFQCATWVTPVKGLDSAFLSS